MSELLYHPTAKRPVPQRRLKPTKVLINSTAEADAVIVELYEADKRVGKTTAEDIAEYYDELIHSHPRVIARLMHEVGDAA